MKDKFKHLIFHLKYLEAKYDLLEGMDKPDPHTQEIYLGTTKLRHKIPIDAERAIERHIRESLANAIHNKEHEMYQLIKDTFNG